MLTILQCGHGKSPPSFLPGSGHKKAGYLFGISCLGMPPAGGGLFSFFDGLSVRQIGLFHFLK